MAIPINILKGTRSILKWFESANISMTDGFCHSVDLSINSLDLWDEFDPNINKGELTIKILIGSKTYEFMCEEREVPIEIDGTVFSVWGRTKQAWLDAPYARTVKDTEETSHPWQSGDVKVSEIISHILTNYCKEGLSVTWNVEDFMVYEGTFSVDEQTPISIISSLADIIGAKINAHPDGSLTIDYYSVEEQIPVESYNDLDHIVSFTESNQYSQGYNAITISGKGTESSPQLQYEVIELNDEDRWQLNIARTVRVYYYHPDGLTPISYALSGMSVSFIGSGVKITTEDVLLTWGSGSKSVFDQDGNSDVEGSNSIPIAVQSVSYQTNYMDFKVIVSTEEETSAMFYFSDKSVNSILTVDLDGTSNADEGKCSSLQLEMTYKGNGICGVKLYGDSSLIETGYDVAGGYVGKPTYSKYKKIQEFIILTDGKGSLSKPYFNNITYDFPGAGTSLTVTQHSTEIKVDHDFSIYGEDDVIPPIAVYVTYNTIYHYGDINVPNSFLSHPEKYDQYGIYYETKCDGIISASVSLDSDSDSDSDSGLLVEFSSTKVGDVELKIYGDPELIDKVYDSEGNELSVSGLETELVEEDVVFFEGEGSLSKPYYDGIDANETVEVGKYSTSASILYEDVMGGPSDQDIEDSYDSDDPESDLGPGIIFDEDKYKVVSVKYLTMFSRARTSDVTEPVESYNAFLEDKDGGGSSFSADITDDEPEDDCSGVQLEVESNYIDGMKNVLGINNDLQHRYFYFRYYGDPEKFSRAYSSIGVEVSLLFATASYVGYPFDLKYKIDGYEAITEQVEFTEGEGSLTWPCCSDFSDVLGGDKFTITNYDDEGSPPTPVCTLYSKNVSLSSGPDYQGVSKHLFANTTYFTTWINGYVQVPIEYDGEVTVYVETTCGDLLSVSTTVTSMENAVFRDVTINIKDYTSDVAVGDVEVYIDDVYRGTTDPLGNITLQDLQTGDHTLRLVASGYMSSDEDDLANETFTVE
ncbi:MAG: hypothetical protein WC516_08920 [Patescibacteria group bacterium]